MTNSGISKRVKTRAAAFVVALVVCICISGCKGRTMENMEPAGDTVELTPDTLPSGAVQFEE